LVAAVSRGESRSLVLKGEAGIGKTALLEYGPLLDTLETLPAPQRHAMEIVFGLSAGEPSDRFLVGLAVWSCCARSERSSRRGQRKRIARRPRG
jgi:hypothetical protein